MLYSYIITGYTENKKYGKKFRYFQYYCVCYSEIIKCIVLDKANVYFSLFFRSGILVMRESISRFKFNKLGILNWKYHYDLLSCIFVKKIFLALPTANP